MSYQPPDPNPYASPAYVSPPVDPLNLPPHATAKAQAIITDAGQFWLAILLCIVCSGIGSIIIGPWYFVRYMQWNSLGREYPQLLDPGSPSQFAQRFQGARIKLMIGIGFGVGMLGLVFLYFLIRIGMASN